MSRNGLLLGHQLSAYFLPKLIWDPGTRHPSL